MALYQKGGPMSGSPVGSGPDPFKARNLGGMSSSIAPTVKKAKVYDGRTGELVQNDDAFTPQEIAMGAGRIPGGVRIQPGTGSGSPNARIGNPGGVMAPPSPNALEANGRPGMGSLTDFYAANTADPVTGMALKPSAHEQLQTRAANEQGGVAGFQRQAALDAYYRAQQAGDPFSAAGARQALLEMRALQNAMGLPKPATDASLKAAGEGMLAPQMVAAALGMSNPALGAIAQMQGFLPKRAIGGPVYASDPRGEDSNDLGGLFSGPGAVTTGPEDVPGTYANVFGRRSVVPGMASGGKAKGLNPYMVGEVGPEVYVPEHGKPEVVGAAGPEIRTFREDGEIIPNHEIKAAADGANVKKTAPREPESRWHFFKDSFGKSPIGREFLGLQNWAEQPSAVEDQLARVFSPANKYGLGMFDPNWESNPNLPKGVQRTADITPAQAAAQPMQAAQQVQEPIPAPAPSVFSNRIRWYDDSLMAPAPGPGWQEGGFLNPYLNALLNSPVLETAGNIVKSREGMTSIPGVRSLSPIQSTEQSFLTPYGKVGVSYGQPKKEGVFEGLPASEWFQRAANRQGEENKYAKVERGYETATQKKERERSNLKKAGVL